MRVSKMRDVTRVKIPSLCGAIWRTILNVYASQGVWVNCYRIHQKSLNFIYPFKLYSNFTNKNVSWLHFSWATQYGERCLLQSDAKRTATGCNVFHTSATRCSNARLRTTSQVFLCANDIEITLILVVPILTSWSTQIATIYVFYSSWFCPQNNIWMNWRIYKLKIIKPKRWR